MIKSVADFGALGDDTDQADQIQKALDSSDWLYFPPGFYDVGKRLIVRDGQRITLSGNAIISPTKDIGTARAIFYCAGVSDVTIEGAGTIDGWSKDYPDSQLFGVMIDSGCARITIRGLDIRNMASEGTGNRGGDGIYVGQQTSNFTGVPEQILIDGCRLSGNDRCGVGITSVQGIKIVNCDISSSRFGAGIDCEPNGTTLPLDDVLVSGCTLKGNACGGVSIGPLKWGQVVNNHLRIVGNYFMDNGGTYPTLGIKAARDVLCSGNLFHHKAQSPCVMVVNSRRVHFSGNSIQGGTWGVQISETSPDASRNVTTQGNSIWGQSLGGILHDVANIQGTTIAGNAISNDKDSADRIRYRGISIRAGAVVGGNAIDLEEGDAGISAIDPTQPGVVIGWNTIKGPVTKAIANGWTGNTLQGNVIK